MSEELDWLDSEAATEVMSMMVFQLSPIAHAFQKLGEPIPTKAEAEQAFVMRWLLKKVREHGDDWRKIASAELGVMLFKLKAMKDAEAAVSTPAQLKEDGNKEAER